LVRIHGEKLEVMDAERFKEEYKYVIRFMKEARLNTYWREYCTEYDKNHSRSILDPTSIHTIDRLLGAHDFTSFLKEKGVYLRGEMISDWFRAYITIINPKIRLTYYTPSHCISTMKKMIEKKKIEIIGKDN